MKKFDVEIIVGIFVFCGLLCLAYMSVRLGKINLLGDHYYPVNAVFSSVKGLKKDTVVEISGVEVGKVDNIKLIDYQAVVSLLIRDDIELQNKIQQQLTDQENKVLEQARNLRKDSLSALGTITDTKGGWGGLAWEDLDPQLQADLINFIKPYPDLTISLVRDSLRITKQQQVFENSIATQKIKTSTLTGTGLSPEAEAVLNGTLRLEDLTPTTKGRIAGELSAAGYKSLPKLSSAQQEDLATMATVRGQIGQLEAFNKDGQLEGVGAFGLGSLKSLLAQIGLSSEEGMSVRALMGNIKGTLAKLRGGTSFTVNEEKLLDTYTPSINDNPAVIVNKMALLKDFINSKI